MEVGEPASSAEEVEEKILIEAQGQDEDEEQEEQRWWEHEAKTACGCAHATFVRMMREKKEKREEREGKKNVVVGGLAVSGGNT